MATAAPDTGAKICLDIRLLDTYCVVRNTLYCLRDQVFFGTKDADGFSNQAAILGFKPNTLVGSDYNSRPLIPLMLFVIWISRDIGYIG